MLNWFHCFQALIGEAENIVQQIFIAALVFSQKFYAHYLDTPTSVSDPFINQLFVKNVSLNILALLFFLFGGVVGLVILAFIFLVAGTHMLSVPTQLACFTH